MTVTEVIMSILSLAAGTVLGAIFFGGLWWTVRHALTSKQPALIVLGSMLGRTGLVVVGFYLVSGGQWQQLLFCLAGFVIARLIAVRVRPKDVARRARAATRVTHHAS